MMKFCPCGVHTYLRDSAALGDSFSIMLLLNLSNPNNPFYINFQAKSNSEVNFLNFIKAAVLAGQLKYRDFFIVNNTSIHYSQGTWAELELLLDAMNQLRPPNEKYKW